MGNYVAFTTNKKHVAKMPNTYAMSTTKRSRWLDVFGANAPKTKSTTNLKYTSDPHSCDLNNCNKRNYKY